MRTAASGARLIPMPSASIRRRAWLPCVNKKPVRISVWLCTRRVVPCLIMTFSYLQKPIPTLLPQEKKFSVLRSNNTFNRKTLVPGYSITDSFPIQPKMKRIITTKGKEAGRYLFPSYLFQSVTCIINNLLTIFLRESAFLRICQDIQHHFRRTAQSGSQRSHHNRTVYQDRMLQHKVD